MERRDASLLAKSTAKEGLDCVWSRRESSWFRSDLDEAISLLDGSHVDGVLANRQGLERHLHHHHPSPFKLAAFDIASSYGGIARPKGSPLTQPLNEVILQLHTQIRLQEIRNNWQRYIRNPLPADAQVGDREGS